MPLTKRERDQRYLLRVRRRARARVVQALYAWDAARDGTPIDVAIERLWADTALGAAERAHAQPVVDRLLAGVTDIDAQLKALTHNWRPERIGAVERAVLRTAAAELTATTPEGREPTPPRVVIQEAVLLAERFGSDASARFVNGVLDALGRRLGRL